MVALKALFTALTAVAAVSAQACTPDLLVDDMSDRTPSMFRPSRWGDVKMVNLIGGDYGVDPGGSRLTLDNGSRSLDVFPFRNESAITAQDTQPWVHPPEPVARNYFFFKFAWDDMFDICYNLSPYQGIEMDVASPPGSDFLVTLTQKFPNCTERTKDTMYLPMTKYIPNPNGQPQNMYIPWSDFGGLWDGTGPQDLVHNKDITFVNMLPDDGSTKFSFTKIVLRGNCPRNTTTAATTTTAAPSGGAATTAGGATASATQTVQNKSGAGSAAPAGVLSGAFAALMGALALI
ncbi:hypothetical protein HDV05_003319 [Chytridiales sp. JEL 0842]|nr:hypothetical protein HDV05_003319 [Chytridiales sp. JEL 0842]